MFCQLRKFAHCGAIRLLARCALASASLSHVALAFTGEDDFSPGTMALGFNRHTGLWGNIDLGLVDGKITTSPPDSSKYDRRIDTVTNIGFDAAIAGRYGLRLNAKSELVKRRQSQDQAPGLLIDDSIMTYSPSADFTFITEKGLEVFGGVMDQIIPTYAETQSSQIGASKYTFHTSTAFTQRFGFVRRAGAWSGGCYYVLGGTSDRRVDQYAFDGSGASTTDTVFVPSQIGIMGNFKAGQTTWDFELDFVQARGLGPRDSAGNTTMTDYFAAHVGTSFDLTGGLALKTGLAYQTFSYASSAFVTLDTVPTSTAKLLFSFGGATDYAYAGAVYSAGRDGQSLPEFNAKYQLNAGALLLGTNISL